MHEIIDCACDVGAYAPELARAGVGCVIRYYNNRNTPAHPAKCLADGELNALNAAGLAVAVVFQQRGGASGDIGDLSGENGARDGRRALELATSLGQPEGSAVYFAVDRDFASAPDLSRIDSYFANARTALAGRYRVGVYGSGLICSAMRSAGHADHAWLSGHLGWTGTEAALASGDWTIFQKFTGLISPIGNFAYDGNILNPAVEDFGQFLVSAA